MEQVKKIKSLTNIITPALVIVAITFAIVIIAFGIDSIAPGAHDTFHDFRHAIGMPCH